MESLLLGFREELNVVNDDDTKNPSPSGSQRLVPWLSWDEWTFVKDSLFSDSPHSVSSALNRIAAWRSRGCLPVPVEVTASIIEIQRKDPWFRANQSNDASLSEELFTMLYCMSIMRLVNGFVEKTRKKQHASIGAVADAIGIPRMVIDVRHEGSHRELPSLKVVRSASFKALDWLKSSYWEPQAKAIPFQGEENVKIKKEIKSKIRELAICLKVNESPHSNTSRPKEKSVKHGVLFGRNKLLTRMVGKSQTSRSEGPMKQITRTLKSILRLYSSFSSEVVSLLLEYLLKALSSSQFKDNADDESVGISAQHVLADWKPIIVKLWKKEPELILNLLKAVLNMIDEDMKREGGNHYFGISQLRTESCRIHHLSSLFAWLVGILRKTPATVKMPKRVLDELIRKSLLISRLCNKQLMDSALRLAELMDDSSLLQRLRKLSSLIGLSNIGNADNYSSSLLTSNNISQFEESISEAAKKLELVKQQVMKNRNPTAMDCETKKSPTWTLAKSWNQCPIGMLPRPVGLSGRLPVLDNIDNKKQDQVSEREENWKLIKHGAKRDATSALDQLDNSTVKKMRETQESSESNHALQIQGDEECSSEGVVWKRDMQEQQATVSSVRILV